MSVLGPANDIVSIFETLISHRLESVYITQIRMVPESNLSRNPCLDLAGRPSALSETSPLITAGSQSLKQFSKPSNKVSAAERI